MRGSVPFNAPPEKTLLSTTDTYDPHLRGDLASAEMRHFWFCARRAIIVALARRCALDTGDTCRVLEIGCGTGNVLSAIKQALPGATVIGMDYYADGFDRARELMEETRLIQGDIFTPPFGPEFGMVGLFDVLEHLPDDERALDEVRGLLNDDGRLLITVPAHPGLWSYADEIACHQRRYRERELREKLERSGFVVEYLSPFLSVVLPLAWLGRLVYRRAGGQAQTFSGKTELFRKELRVVPGINGLLRTLLTAEAYPVSHHWRIPFGSSLVAVARKQ